MLVNTTLTAVKGISVGHWTNTQALTGCTVVLCPPEGCIGSGYALGASPGTRELSLLQPEKAVEEVHAVVLTGGSAFGLASVTGVVDWLEEQGRGLDTPHARIPIVPAAVVYDLATGDATVRPDRTAGLKAAQDASSEPLKQGRVGAGAGTTVGKYFGFEYASFGGLGSSSLSLGDATVAALAVVNAVGDVISDEGTVLAGATISTERRTDMSPMLAFAGTNTTLLVIATDAVLTKAQAYSLSQSAHIGIASTVRPSHTLHDGDTSFVLSTAQVASVPMMALGIGVQEVTRQAIQNAVRTANNL